MTMKRLLPALLLLTATSILASDDSYRFRAAWIDDHYELTEGDGTHWKWLTLGCPQNVPCSIRINSHGGVGSDHPADLGLGHVGDHAVSVECQRETGCALRIGSGQNEIEKNLAPNESTDVPSGEFIRFTALSPRH
jgi:hypothetical protein